MLDSVNLEKMGVPTVTVVTEPFVAAAEAVRTSLGLPDLPLLVIPHDYLHEDLAAVRARIAPRVDEVLDKLATAP